MWKEPPNTFIDTNVWFSSFYGSPNCQKLIRAHVEGKIKAVISRQVLVETVRNINEKIPHAIYVFEKTLKEAPPYIVKDPVRVHKNISRLVSKEDRVIMGAAISAKVKYFVTGNIADFKKREILSKFKIEILTPKQAVDLLGLK